MLRFPFSIHPRAAQPSSAVNDQVFSSTSATPAGPRRALSLPSPWDKCQNLGCGWAEAQTPPAAAFGDPGAHVTDAVISRVMILRLLPNGICIIFTQKIPVKAEVLNKGQNLRSKLKNWEPYSLKRCVVSLKCH